MTSSLIPRLEAGNGADEALDLAIIKVLLPEAVVMRGDTDECGNVIPGKAHEYTHWRLTSSLDADLALAEIVLPGCEYLIGKGKLTPDEPLFGARILFGPNETQAEGEHTNSLPRALLIALLKALEQSK